MNRYKLSKAGVNATEGISRFNGDKALYETVLHNFTQDETYAQLCTAIQAGDEAAAFKAAHSLKGVAGNLSLTRLYDDVYPLVEELRAGRIESAQAMLDTVTQDYQAIIAALEPHPAD